jgi:hypothetical protein
MSGGGGGGYGPSRSSDDCNIVEQTALNSVNSATLPQLAVGTRLEVDVVQQNNRPVLVARLPNAGAIVGALTPPSLADLLDCISRGRVYVAVVISIQSALVRVEIRPR